MPLQFREKIIALTFSSEVVIYPVPYEDRKSQWMEMALDRYRLERRDREFEFFFLNLRFDYWL